MKADHEAEAIVRWLSLPQTYSHHPGRVEHIETHISHVFLVGEYVYKLKKRLRFDFLDFSTLEAREFACREEVRLNRRLAPATYLEVASIVRHSGGGLAWAGLGAGPGDVVDWVVKMRRLPTDETLEALHARGELRPEQIERLAAKLIEFYRTLPPVAVTGRDYLETYRSHAQDNFPMLLEADDRLARRVRGFQLSLLALSPEVFAERTRSGRIVEGHGDLRPEHICLCDPIAIFDCIEFNREFRIVDVVDELAFLASECDALGAEWVGERVAEAYRKASGDDPPGVLWAFYKSYRACVRAKVATLRERQTTGEEQIAAATSRRMHLQLADRYSRPWIRPRAIVVGGLSGTGKTTLARELATTLGAELLRTDVIRQEIYGSSRRNVAANRGHYRPEARDRVYDALLQSATKEIAEQRSVILDGTFAEEIWLRSARSLVADSHLFLAVECVCTPQTARKRIELRREAGEDASEARSDVYDAQSLAWKAWPEDLVSVRVDTEQSLANQSEKVLVVLRDQQIAQNGLP